jgi:hypothetical protein
MLHGDDDRHRHKQPEERDHEDQETEVRRGPPGIAGRTVGG